MKIAICVESPLGRAALSASSAAATLPGAEIWWVHAGPQALDTQNVPDHVAGVLSLVAPQWEGAHSTSLAAGLAAVIRAHGFALVLSGSRSDKQGTGMIPSALAVQLDWPFVAQIRGLALQSDLTRVRLQLQVNAGTHDLQATLPLVLACVPGETSSECGPAHNHQLLSLADVGIEFNAIRRARDIVKRR